MTHALRDMSSKKKDEKKKMRSFLQMTWALMHESWHMGSNAWVMSQSKARLSHVSIECAVMIMTHDSCIRAHVICKKKKTAREARPRRRHVSDMSCNAWVMSQSKALLSHVSIECAVGWSEERDHPTAHSCAHESDALSSIIHARSIETWLNL